MKIVKNVCMHAYLCVRVHARVLMCVFVRMLTAGHVGDLLQLLQDAIHA